MNGRYGVAMGTAIAVALAWVSGCADAPPQGIPGFGPTSGVGNGSTGVGGATGSSGSGAANSLDAQDFYEQEVHELMMTECGSCHSPGGQGPSWLDDGSVPSATYSFLESYPGVIEGAECSSLMLKSKGQHAGPSFSAELEGLVGQWLGKEATERGLMCDGNTISGCDQAIAAFQACMHINHWELTEMDRVARQQVAGGGPCYSCHTSGNGQALLALDSQDTFDAHKNDQYFLLKLVTCSTSGGQFQGLTPANRYINKGLEGCVTGPNQPCHPDYVLTPEREQAVVTYVDEVMTAMANNTCDQLAAPPP